MEKETLAALKASIEHWEELTKVTRINEVDLGPHACALCGLFNTINTPDKDACKQCPVYASTGITHCSGSPYTKAFDQLDVWETEPSSPGHAEDFRKTAKAELDFLKSLLPKGITLPDDCREWEFYPIEMPVNNANGGPATVGEDAVRMTYEVWDRLFVSHGSFDYLPDAINLAIKLTKEARST